MRLMSLAAALMLSIAALPAQAIEVGGKNAFEFIALGDVPYKLPDDYPRFAWLIGKINEMKPSFSIHIGDIKSGSTPCTDENILKVKGMFETFEQPLVYSIGDNEWTDCHREKAGKFDPIERLSRLREWFFAEPMSFGKQKLALERQSEVNPDMKASDGKLFVENSRWMKNRVMFVVPHIPGSNNDFEPRGIEFATEYYARNKANLAWIASSFAKAKAENAAAVVIAYQAELQDIRQGEPGVPVASGFRDTINAIEKAAKDFGKPVLAINGDNHIYYVTPFLNVDGKPVPNMTRLQVMGETIVGAVRVIVDPDSELSPFTFQAINEPAK